MPGVAGSAPPVGPTLRRLGCPEQLDELGWQRPEIHRSVTGHSVAFLLSKLAAPLLPGLQACRPPGTSLPAGVVQRQKERRAGMPLDAGRYLVATKVVRRFAFPARRTVNS